MNFEPPQGGGGAGMINVLNLNPPPDPFYSPHFLERPSYRRVVLRLSPSEVSPGAGPPHSSIFWGVQSYLTFLILCQMG